MQVPSCPKVRAKRVRTPPTTSPFRFSGCQNGLHPCRSVYRNRPRIAPRAVLDFLSPELRIDPERIRTIPNSRTMHGGKADVEKALLLPGDRCPERGSRHVALKKLRFDEDTDDRRTLAPFVHEVAVLSHLRHKNVVKFLGFVEDSDKGIAWIVLSWEVNGTLRDYIQSEDRSFGVRLSLILDVICGVLYLHSRDHPICHGDLKSVNILVGYNGRAVLSDFGSARAIEQDIIEELHDGAHLFSPAAAADPQPQIHLGDDDKSTSLSGPAWTLRWAAPELLKGALPSLKSDIWALGWICWEVLTGKLPFYHAPTGTHVVLDIMSGHLPGLWYWGNYSPIHTLITFMTRCWTIDPNFRPSLDVLIG
ncbi:hypothetical protein M407DRAFT_20831 [Tulasnella calospora MUT 4182]|uniref:Protein kinase domain-containing protein n=1 Tax=Tulasnella calospora MUT 4182 TaxID=1051891 RepID=A0A0C3QFH1_9AGAM|nr:hypothetical protein M407DRAFT_20831 [Tulasnella calospora MUT 4182]